MLSGTVVRCWSSGVRCDARRRQLLSVGAARGLAGRPAGGAVDASDPP